MKTTNGRSEEQVTVHECTSRDIFQVETDEEKKISDLLGSFWKQREYYREIFRDGQDTVSRNFTYNKNSTIKWKRKDSNVQFLVHFCF